MTIHFDKAEYTGGANENVQITYSITNDWNPGFGTKARVKTQSPCYNNGVVQYSPWLFIPQGQTKRDSFTMKPISGKRCVVSAKSVVSRLSDGKELTESTGSYYVSVGTRNKPDIPDIPTQPYQPYQPDVPTLPYKPYQPNVPTQPYQPTEPKNIDSGFGLISFYLNLIKEFIQRYV